MSNIDKNKSRMFDLMGINENINGDINSDVMMINNLKTNAYKTAMSRINTQEEFNEAFDSWFNSLGFDDEMK